MLQRKHKFTFCNVNTNSTSSVLTNCNTLHTDYFILILRTYNLISSSQDTNHKIVHTLALVCSGCVHQNAQQC